MFKGKAWKYGDDVDTDVIIPARYLTSFDPDVLKTHCLEDLDADFAGKVRPGDLIVAGNNFGCGSSREHAPLAIKGAGVSCVIARSFARIFFRNSFNIGLPILESDEAVAGIDSGDEVEADLTTGKIVNLTKSAEYQARPAPEFMQELVTAGGLIEYAKKRLSEKKPEPVKVVKVKEAPKGPGARMKELEEEAPEAGKDAPWVEEEPAAPATEDQRLDADEDDDDE